MKIDILDVKIHDRLKIFTSQGLIIGYVVDILEANIKPSVDKVLKYYDINIDHKHFKSFSMSIKVDRIIIAQDSGKYFVLPRTEKADRYLLDVQLVN